LHRGHEAIRAQAWASAFSHLSEADRESPLEAEDIERLATAAQLSGRESESLDLLARAHQTYLIVGDTHRAVRCALWLGFRLLFSGEQARASGWLARARRLLDGQPECVEHGYLLLPDGLTSIRQGEPAAAFETFKQATEIGRRFADRDLETMGLHGQGRALIRLGKRMPGVMLLDEAMVAVTSGEVSPIIAGTIYCSVIESCNETLDLRRAHEWTSALSHWCTAQPQMVAFHGSCLLHRAEVMQLRGAWTDALDEAQRACERLSQPVPRPSLGAAFYRAAELYRLRGEFGEAEQVYRKASQFGRTPQPGFALLRLAQGQSEAARAAIRNALNETRESIGRATVLEAFVEIALTTNDVSAAHEAACELARIADEHGAPLLQAISANSTGAVSLAEENIQEALHWLRLAWKTWCELEAPYQAARARVLIALASRRQGDHDTSDLELASACETFTKLGALPDVERVRRLSRWQPCDACPLSVREVEVLKLIASGATNRKIAAMLGISEKTVARHVSNIFVKLDLSSRAAATAYAYQHHLA
jgi:DNA-binding CsgD family transcriptional regulator/tetratricopeptide (TPR) repeat protein